MTKTAVFVEGQTELILLREYLLRKFNWSVDIECRRLFREQFQVAQFDNRIETADRHFLLVDIGNDQKVISALLEREKGLIKNGYTKIIGLRDMYSREYKDFRDSIDNAIVTKFINNHSERLQARKSQAVLFFAIMEIEAWILGLREVLERLDPKLTTEFINKELGFDLGVIDPETTRFHPAQDLNNIYELVGSSYDKHKSDIEALAKILTCEDYDNLYLSDKCNAFKPFYETLLQ